MNRIVAQMIPVAKLIELTFGKDCEVVLHDLTTPQNSVVYAANNGVTGRAVGQSFNHLITHVLLSETFSDDVCANYFFKTPDGRLIRSSTALIKEDDKVVGALCVNLPTAGDIAQWKRLSELLRGAPEEAVGTLPKEAEKRPPVGSDSRKIMEIANDLIDEIIGQQDASRMQREDKIKLVQFMYEKGIFLIKGTIDVVAEKLNVSKVTIYSYLNEIRD